MAIVEDDRTRWLVTSPSGRGAWAAFLAEAPTADPLQSWAWAEAGTAIPPVAAMARASTLVRYLGAEAMVGMSHL